MGRKKRGPREAAPGKSPASNLKSDGMAALHPEGHEKLPERLEAVRRWIAAGGHNRPEVAEAVARRILARGEIRDDRDGEDDRIFGRSDSHIH